MPRYAFLPPCSLPSLPPAPTQPTSCITSNHHHRIRSSLRPTIHARHTVPEPAPAPAPAPTVFTKDGRTYQAIDWQVVESLAATLTHAVGAVGECVTGDTASVGAGGGSGAASCNWDVILAITRGGLAPAALVAEGLGVRNVLCATVMFYTDEGDAFFGLRVPRFLAFPPAALLRGQRVLIVDDVWDSGATAVAVRERVARAGATKAAVAVLHFKEANPNRMKDTPDFFADTTDRWIIYPWEVLARRNLNNEIVAAGGTGVGDTANVTTRGANGNSNGIDVKRHAVVDAEQQQNATC